MPVHRIRRLLSSTLVTVLLGLALWQPLFDAGSDRVDAMFDRALVAFASARALNGVISVIQGTEVALQPAGVGVTLTVGEMLDPLNDLVERFSWIMLAATAALGAQSVLIEAFGDGVLGLILVVLGAAAIARHWWPALQRLDHGGLIPRLLILLLFLRLALPLAALGAHGFSERWLEPRREAAVAELDRTRLELDAIEAAGPDLEVSPDEGMFDSMRRYLAEQRARFDLEARLQALGDRLDRAAERLIDLVVVFVLQTILVPLGVIWLLWRLTRMLVTGMRTMPLGEADTAAPATADPRKPE